MVKLKFKLTKKMRVVLISGGVVLLGLLVLGGWWRWQSKQSSEREGGFTSFKELLEKPTGFLELVKKEPESELDPGFTGDSGGPPTLTEAEEQVLGKMKELREKMPIKNQSFEMDFNGFDKFVVKIKPPYKENKEVFYRWAEVNGLTFTLEQYFELLLN